VIARRLIVAAILVPALTSCADGSRSDPAGQEVTALESSAAPTPSNLPVKDLMRGLEDDLATVAHGIWRDDSESVELGAGRIAGHPRATSDQVAIIQATLGSEFGSFVQLDQGVHQAAADLAQLAADSAPSSQLFDQFVRVQEGCFSCHTQFRSRVSEALSETAESP